MLFDKMIAGTTGKTFALCRECDWMPFSMKNSGTAIYGPGVTKSKDNEWEDGIKCHKKRFADC
jgi:hypothetical protein